MARLKDKSKISRNLLAVLILVVVSFGIYANSLQGDFVWDDTELFIKNYDRWQWNNLKELLTVQDNLFGSNDNGFYRPLPNLTFLLDRYIWGRQPFGFHLTNIVFHVLSTITVFFLARVLLASFYAGLAAGLIFAVHPIHTEVVAWINGRNNVLSSLFYLISFYFYIRHRDTDSRKFYAVSLAALAASLFSKEYAVTLPFLMLLYEISYSSPFPVRKVFLYKLGRTWFGYFFIFAGYAVIRSMVLSGGPPINLHLQSLGIRLFNVPKILLAYIKLLILPLNLNILHPVSFVWPSFSFRFLSPIIITVILLLLWWHTFRRSKAVFLGFGWIVVTLLPVLNIIPIPNVDSLVAERYLYLPSVGLCILAASFFSWLSGINRLPASRLMRYLAASLFLLFIEVYAFQTLQRNLVWRNELTLWRDTVGKSPGNFKVRCNLSIALHGAGRYDEALEHIREAVRLNPGHDTPHFIMGYILYNKGRFAHALNALEKALEINPRHADARVLSEHIKIILKRLEKGGK